MASEESAKGELGQTVTAGPFTYSHPTAENPNSQAILCLQFTHFFLQRIYSAALFPSATFLKPGRVGEYIPARLTVHVSSGRCSSKLPLPAIREIGNWERIVQPGVIF